MRFFAEEYGLGYDFFGSIMNVREQQCRNLAQFVLSFGERVLIVGEYYKPGVSLKEGSYSRLVSTFLSEMGAEVFVVEPSDFSPDLHFDVALLSYDTEELAKLPFPPGSLIVDPWRTFAERSGRDDIHVVSYGDTRAYSR